MKQSFFLSDIHLRDMQDEKAQKLLRFFISLQPKAEETIVFLVGDIFDLWLADHDYFINKFSPLIDQVRNFVFAGGEVHYFEGNHDLHLKYFWQDDLGVIVHSNPEYFLLNGLHVRVEHGDQMDPLDRGYHFLRWLLRTPLITWIILHLPGPFVANVGKWMSRTSRSYTNSIRNPESIKNVIHQHAIKIYEEKKFDVLISGHVHLRDEFSFKKGPSEIKSYNLGSWDQETLALCLVDQKWKWQALP